MGLASVLESDPGVVGALKIDPGLIASGENG
jgi:hypothetical protein